MLRINTERIEKKIFKFNSFNKLYLSNMMKKFAKLTKRVMLIFIYFNTLLAHGYPSAADLKGKKVLKYMIVFSSDLFCKCTILTMT